MLLLVVISNSRSYYYTKHQSKPKKHLLPYHDANNKSKGIDTNDIS